MSGIKAPIVDVMTKLRAIMQVDNPTVPMFQTVRLWNNQTTYEKEGQYVGYNKPAVFLEVLNDVAWDQLLEGVTVADLGIVFHIIHEFYDDQAGNFEQDLIVFDLRDAITKAFMLYQPPGCCAMMKVSETMDYEHDNIYHYIVQFVCSFVDDKGIKTYAIQAPPTGVDLTAVFIDPKNYTKQL